MILGIQLTLKESGGSIIASVREKSPGRTPAVVLERGHFRPDVFEITLLSEVKKFPWRTVSPVSVCSLLQASRWQLTDVAAQLCGGHE